MANGKEFLDRESPSKEIWDPNLGSGRDVAAENAPHGAPKTKAKVVSTFDARPINAYDFWSTGPATIVSDYTGGVG